MKKAILSSGIIDILSEKLLRNQQPKITLEAHQATRSEFDDQRMQVVQAPMKQGMKYLNVHINDANSFLEIGSAHSDTLSLHVMFHSQRQATVPVKYLTEPKLQSSFKFELGVNLHLLRMMI